jgi:hypothetical protein
MKGIAQQRINRRQQRLHRVIQQMAKTNRQQNLKNSFRAGVAGSIGNKCADFAFARHFSEPASHNKRNPLPTRSTTLEFIASPLQARFSEGEYILRASCQNGRTVDSQLYFHSTGMSGNQTNQELTTYRSQIGSKDYFR